MSFGQHQHTASVKFVENKDEKCDGSREGKPYLRSAMSVMRESHLHHLSENLTATIRTTVTNRTIAGMKIIDVHNHTYIEPVRRILNIFDLNPFCFSEVRNISKLIV